MNNVIFAMGCVTVLTLGAMCAATFGRVDMAPLLKDVLICLGSLATGVGAGYAAGRAQTNPEGGK